MTVRHSASILWAAFGLALASCGGGGGGGTGGSSAPAAIRAEPANIVLETDRGAQVVQQPLRLVVQADEVEVDLAPGAADVMGVDVFLDFASDTMLTGFVQGSPAGLARGSQQTTLRFTAISGSSRAFVDVPVRFDVLEPFSLSNNDSLSFGGFDGAPATEIPIDDVRQILGDRVNWQLLSDVPWLTVAPGAGTGDAQVTFTADGSGLPLGSNPGTVRVTESRSRTDRTLSANYFLRPAQLVVTPRTDIDLRIDTDTVLSSLASTLSVGSEVRNLDPAKAVTWTARAGNPQGPVSWVRSVPSSAPSVPVRDVRIEPDPEVLRTLKPGTDFATLEFDYTDGAGAAQQRFLTVNLDYRLPLVRGIWPPVIAPNQSATIIAGYEDSGLRFESGVRIGGQAPTVVQVSVPPNALLGVPALAPGDYEVTVPNAAGIDRSFGTLIVRAPPAIAATAIESPGVKSRLLHDPVAEALYAVDRNAGQLLRYRLDGGAWVASPPRALAGIRDASLSVATDRVFAITAGALHAASLSDGAGAFEVVEDDFVDPFGCAGEGVALTTLAAARLNLYLGPIGCDFARGRVWDEIRGQFDEDLGLDSISSAVIAESGPLRSRAASAESRGDGTSRVTVTNAQGAPNDSFLVNGEVFALGYSDFASLLLINDEFVYGSFGAGLLGRVPRADAAALSPLGNRIYAFVSLGVLGGRIDVYDTSAATVGGAYPQVATIPVSVDVGLPLTLDPTERRRSIAVRLSTDGRTLFVSGAARIAVIPVGGV